MSSTFLLVGLQPHNNLPPFRARLASRALAERRQMRAGIFVVLADNIDVKECKQGFSTMESAIGTTPQNDELLWHYTSWAGLTGILEGRHLRGSNARYVNDTHEVIYGLKEIDPQIKSSSHEYLKQVWETSTTASADALFKETYIISFCSHELSDDLGQWRGYTASNESRFALGFDRQELAQLADAHGWGMFECVYDQKEQQELLKPLLDGLDRLLNEVSESSDLSGPYSPQVRTANRAYHVMQRGQSSALLLIASRIKSKYFKAENEIRFIRQQNPEDTCDGFFKRNRLIIPCLELPKKKDPECMKLLPLKRIVVGPAHDDEKKLNAQSIGMYIKKLGYALGEVDVLQFNIPFRGP